MTDPITPAELDKLDKIVGAATVAPWIGPVMSDCWPPGWIAIAQAYEDEPGEHISGTYFITTGHIGVAVNDVIAKNPEAQQRLANTTAIVALRNSYPSMVETIRQLRAAVRELAPSVDKLKKQIAFEAEFHDCTIETLWPTERCRRILAVLGEPIEKEEK